MATVRELIQRSPVVSGIRIVSAPDTARLVRIALKRAFPATTFRVRTRQYSGGSSIDVEWTDGPAPSRVSAVTDRFAGGRFDGTIDLAYGVTHYLTEQGDAILAHDPGTVRSAGRTPAFDNPERPADAVVVRFLADYVFAHRRYSDKDGLRAQILEYLRDHLRPVTGNPPDEYWGDVRLSDLAWRIMNELDFELGTTIDDACRVAVLQAIGCPCFPAARAEAMS